LYPASRGGAIDERLVATAIDDAVRRRVDLINLSLAEVFPTDAIFDRGRFFNSDEYWPSMTADDLPFWSAERLANTEFRDWLSIEPTHVSTAAARAAVAGIEVVAAAGNHLDMLAVPAVCPDVISASFHREQRTATGSLEIARSVAPTYTPSDFSDFSVIQPPDVLGSSFATPLISGFGTLMKPPRALDPYRDMVRLGGMASELFVLSMHSERNLRWEQVMVDLFERAIASRPHQDEAGPCAECSFFALQIYNDFGLLRLGMRELHAAVDLFSVARAIAPHSSFAAANLGVTYGALADSANRGGDDTKVRKLLDRAVDNMTAAVTIRGDPAYAERLREFEAARVDPRGWSIRP